GRHLVSTLPFFQSWAMETRNLTAKLMAKTPKIVRNCEGWANNLLETHPRTQVSQNRTRHRRGRYPAMERTRVGDTQAVCGFRYLASNAPPFFQTVKAITAIFRARVRRAISGLIPFATRAS